MDVFYSILYVLGFLAEITLLGILLFRKQYRTFPVFTSYIAFNVFSDVVVPILNILTQGHVADWVALFLLPPQYFLELGVLLEIALHVLQPVRSSLPKNTNRIFFGLVFFALVIGVILAWRVNSHNVGIYEKAKFPLDLTVGFLRMLLFVVTAAFAQMLGIGWKSKELQIATGLSFYSAADLIASLMQSNMGKSEIADHVKFAAYAFELGFFIWAFTTKEAERREFSPQMRRFLLTISERARDSRAAIVRSQVK